TSALFPLAVRKDSSIFLQATRQGRRQQPPTTATIPSLLQEPNLCANTTSQAPQFTTPLSSHHNCGDIQTAPSHGNLPPARAS
ncbi:hypothetical protein NXF25_005798, partial [Crotalus adamanteus]